MRRFVSLLALCFLPSVAHAAPEESFRLYSDICLNAESGDTHGVRIGVIKLVEARYAFLQWADSYPSEKPDVSIVSDDDYKHGQLVFSVPVNGKPATFRGTITAEAVTGQFSPTRPGDPKVFRLRRESPQKGFPNCVSAR